MKLVLQRRVAAGVAVLAVALVGVGTAAACDGGGTRTAQVKAAQFVAWHHHGGLRHGFLSVTAAYLGLTTDQLKSQLAAGKTLAQIAPTGKTASGLADALVAAARTKLDAAVAKGMITSGQESAWLAKLSAKLTTWANAVWNTTWTWGDRDHDGDGH